MKPTLGRKTFNADIYDDTVSDNTVSESELGQVLHHDEKQEADASSTSYYGSGDLIHRRSCTKSAIHFVCGIWVHGLAQGFLCRLGRVFLATNGAEYGKGKA